jgi:hypothetical protein
VTVNEVPGNEATLSDAPINQNSGGNVAGEQNSGNQSPVSESPANLAASGQGVAPAPQRSQASRANTGRVALALFAAVAAWLVPGLGHLLLGRRGRALVFFCAVSGLVLSGYLLRGNVFPPHSGDPFGTLGFLADAGTGIFYYFSRFFEAAGPDVSRAAGDCGTRFIAAAGVVNLLAVLDTIEISTGRRR